MHWKNESNHFEISMQLKIPHYQGAGGENGFTSKEAFRNFNDNWKEIQAKYLRVGYPYRLQKDAHSLMTLKSNQWITRHDLKIISFLL